MLQVVLIVKKALRIAYRHSGKPTLQKQQVKLYFTHIGLAAALCFCLDFFCIELSSHVLCILAECVTAKLGNLAFVISSSSLAQKGPYLDCDMSQHDEDNATKQKVPFHSNF